MKKRISNKELILKAAEKQFSTKGFSSTKISEIASMVGVSDSTVYEHFENKEDILFTIPKENTQRLIDINEQNLRGLVGEEIKLRKLVWNYMDFLTFNKDYTRLLLFELRPNRDFYETSNYKLIRKFTQIYRNVIQEGQDSGMFSSERSPSLILNLIFGTIDLIMITWLIENKPVNPMESFDDLFDMLLHAIKCRDLEPTKTDKRKQILNAAAEIFSKIGFKKARIQDIAKLAGVGDGTIYKYFSGKGEILFALPVENTKELLSIQKEHLSGIEDTELKLNVLIKDYLHYADTHRDYISICLFDLRYNRLFYRTEAYQLFRKFGLVFYGIILEGIEKGHLRKSVNPYIATKMIMGMIDHIFLSWIKFGNPIMVTNLSDSIFSLTLSSLKQ